ncbi:MAG: hypothetical protein ACK4NS_13410, partial [Saprospiraceae bacterium]
MKNFFTLVVCFIVSVGVSWGQVTVYSQGSGLWDATDLWNTERDGSGTYYTEPNAVDITAVIQSGHTITLPMSPVYKVDDLIVESGGTIRAGVTGNRFLSVFGDQVIIDGTAGGAGDGFSLNIDGPSCTLSGSGTMQLSRIKKDNSTMLGSSVTNFTISNCTLNLSWIGSGAIYNSSAPGPSTPRTFNVTLESGATMNVAGDISINGPNGNNSFADLGTYTFNGTANVNGNLRVRTRASAGYDIQYIINGTFNLGGEIIGNDGNSGSAVANLTINNGGVLKVTKTGNVFTSISSRETYTYNPGSTFEYAAISAQNLRGFDNYQNLTTSGGGAKTLTSDATVNQTLNLLSGNIVTETYTLTLASGGNVTNASTASYVRTNSSGVFKRTISASGELFPIGNSSYNPATLAGDGEYSMRVLDAVYLNGLSGGTTTNRVVNRTWDVTSDAPISGSLDLTVQWNTPHEVGSFDRTNCTVSHYTGGQWVTGGFAAASGGNPWTRTRTGITSLSPFAVASLLSPLPVELLSFNAEKRGQTARLEWRTATEKDNDYFEIERSAGGTAFASIGRVKGAGTTQIPQAYAFD